LKVATATAVDRTDHRTISQSSTVETLKNANRVPLSTTIETYLEQKRCKSLKTIAQYQRTLNALLEVIRPKVRYLDEIAEIARAQTDFFATHRGRGDRGSNIHFNAADAFHDELIRTPKGWRIAFRRLRWPGNDPRHDGRVGHAQARKAVNALWVDALLANSRFCIGYLHVAIFVLV